MIAPKSEEARELARMFFRKWSTQKLTEAARKVLSEDVVQMQALFEALDETPDIFSGAADAPDRHWFAKKFQEL